MRHWKKTLLIIAGALLVPTLAIAAWPSVSARTKTWGAEVLTAADLHGQFDLIHTYINAMMHGTTGHTHTGSTNDGPKVPINTGLTIGSQAQGDVLYASSASAWARLGAGTSGQFLKTQGAAANPTWATVGIPTHAREDLMCSQASTTTITVGLGNVNINGTLVSKTSATTLTISTADNWAGGVSLRAASTFAYIGIDSAGNVKMHTTAPSHSDYAVSNTNGIKRYATWEGTVYRILGWFYMNATGSGELNTFEVGNLKDGNVPNAVIYYTTNTQALNDTSDPPDTDVTTSTIHFYSSGRPVVYSFEAYGTPSTGITAIATIHNFDTSNIANSKKYDHGLNSTYNTDLINVWQDTPAQGAHTYKMQAGVSGGTFTFAAQTYRLEEL